MNRDCDFEKNLLMGRAGELAVARFLQQKGFGVIPCYDYSGPGGAKAPRLQFATNGFAIPDLDVCKEGKRLWVEVKTYRAAAMNRKLGELVHGIESRLFRHYMVVREHTGSPVWIAILERDTRDLVVADMSALKTYPCMCQGCKNKTGCTAEIRDGIYWKRADMFVRARNMTLKLEPPRRPTP